MAIPRQHRLEQPSAQRMPVRDAEYPRGYTILGKVRPACRLLVLQRQQVRTLVSLAFREPEYRYAARPVAPAVPDFVATPETHVEIGAAQVGFIGNQRLRCAFFRETAGECGVVGRIRFRNAGRQHNQYGGQR